MSNRTHPDQNRSASPTRRKRKSGETGSAEQVDKRSPALPKLLEKIRAEQDEAPRGFIHDTGEGFRRAAAWAARAMGSAWTFAGALLLVVGWAICGPFFHYSETWQLVINTGTTIITFLMIFLVQNSQNRDSRAIQLKLDELLRGVHGARTAMVDLEDATDEELEKLQKEFEKLRKKKAEPKET